MILSCHQPNFIPWFPFFEKIAKSDIFVVLAQVQFERNGWQNRCRVNEKWWSNPVEKGSRDDKIVDKRYVSGNSLLEENMLWIQAIATTLEIDTKKIKFDFITDKRATERLVEICQYFSCDKYLTNPEATDKYLDASLFEQAGIEIVPFIPKSKKHIFELFNEIGIQKTKDLLWSK